MELLRLFPVIFLIVGNFLTITTGQGLLGTVENIFGLDDGPQNGNQNPAHNINNYPIRNHLQGSQQNVYNTNSNRNRLNAANNLHLTNFNNDGNNNYNGHRNPTTDLLNMGDHKMIQNGVMQKVNQDNYEDDDVKLAAQKFPALQNVLEKLKELNKQKELQKQNGTNNMAGQTTTIAIDTTEYNADIELTINSKDEKLKVMKKRKFYFQVMPVIPEDQRKVNDLEIVYYED